MTGLVGAEGAPEVSADASSRAREVYRRLVDSYPGARLELDFDGPLQLLVAALLAAQTTDERVNSITPRLFTRYPDAAELAGADPGEMEEILRPVGYYRKKTQAVIKLAAALVERHAGAVPDNVDELVALPGVGRKTANMVLGSAFGQPAVSVDTHVGRVVHRLGWGPEKDPEATEAAVHARFPRAEWTPVNLVLILHGRRICHSRKPACGACPVAELCPSFGLEGKGETDPVKAKALLK